MGPSSGSPVTFNSTDLPAQVPHFNLHDSTIRLSGQRRSLAKPSSGTAEASRECLALIVVRQPRHEDVLAALVELFIARRPPANIRSDNGPEFIATAVQKWLAQIGVSTLYIAFGSPLKRRLQRKLKRVASRRTAQRADFLLPRRGQGADQSLAASLQYRPRAQQPRQPTAGPTSRSIASAVLRFRYASPTAKTGDGGNHALTIRPNYSLGADQGKMCAWFPSVRSPGSFSYTYALKFDLRHFAVLTKWQYHSITTEISQ